TLRLAESGWRYLSDDMMVLHETAAGLEARGFRRLFAVAEPSIAGSSLPRLAEALSRPVIAQPHKRMLAPEIIFPDSRAERCDPRVLFFPRVMDAEQTSIVPIQARAAMQRFVRYCPWATCDAHTAPA